MYQKIFHNLLSLIKFKETHQQTKSKLNFTELHILEKIYKSGHIKTLEIGKVLNIPSSTLIGMLDRLEGLNLITRQRQKDDKRVVLVCLTDDGRRVVKEHINEDKLFLENLISKLDSSERTIFFNLLDKMLSSITNPEDLFKE